MKITTVRTDRTPGRSGPEALRARIRQRLAEQGSLVRSLLSLREQLQGSLFTRYGVCGKEGCACLRGEKHGPYYVLSARSGGTGGFKYLAGPRLDAARVLVDRYRRFRRGLRELKALNQEIVRLLKRYQDFGVRRGGRRLGVPGGSVVAKSQV